tara:strand:- start:639 stop:797 length:159 start_codon:yes stop_codon:yes gene_type:complete
LCYGGKKIIPILVKKSIIILTGDGKKTPKVLKECWKTVGGCRSFVDLFGVLY